MAVVSISKTSSVTILCVNHLCDEWDALHRVLPQSSAHCGGQDFTIVVTEQGDAAPDQPPVSIDPVRLRDKHRPAGSKAIWRSLALNEVSVGPEKEVGSDTPSASVCAFRPIHVWQPATLRTLPCKPLTGCRREQAARAATLPLIVPLPENGRGLPVSSGRRVK